MTLRVALIRGPMYDGLYRLLDGLDVEVVASGDHPTLNAEVAALLSAGERLDLISTHSKYAPSQVEWLRPLDDLVPAELIAQLAPGAVELCRFDGALRSVPRNVDVRVLWARRDLVGEVPDSWEAMVESDAVFGFPTRDSGLFGTFFELVVGAGGQLFDASGSPTIDSAEAAGAVETLRRLAARLPADLPSWHYDELDQALLDGRVAMAASWPGAYAHQRRAAAYPHLTPHAYPAGPGRRVTYAGCHSWAVPVTSEDPQAAVELLGRVVGPEGARLEAGSGAVCSHVDVFEKVAAADGTDARRRRLIVEAMADQMITYPPHRRFPLVEDGGWMAIRDVLAGRSSTAAALARIQAVAGREIAGDA